MKIRGVRAEALTENVKNIFIVYFFIYIIN